MPENTAKTPAKGAQKPTERVPRGQSGEMKVYGVNACRALWQGRASDIIRVYVANERMKEFRSLLKWCAEKKKAYHVLGDAELEKVAQGVHHEGIVFLAKEPKQLNDETLLTKIESLPSVQSLLYLDGVANPHNIGSIMRVAAHFGAAVALGEKGALPRLTPSAARMAEGGMEHVMLAPLAHPAKSLDACKKAGYQIVAASSDGDALLYDKPLPKRVIFAVGNEMTGISSSIRRVADRIVKIPGTGAVESLNVAMATALLLGEFWRQHRSD